MSAAYNISGWWLLFTVIVYAVPIGVFLYERRWLRSLVSPVLTMLRQCPFYMLVTVALLFGQMVVRGSTKTNRTNSVEIELGGEIQAAMDLLCSGYSVEEYDLSMFGKLP